MPLKPYHKPLVYLTVIAFIFTSILSSFAETINYTYDDLNRLKQINYGTGKWIEYYVYDEIGNREEKAIIDNIPPAAPSNLTATAISSSQIDLSWTDNSNNETGFKIERKTGAGGTYSQINAVGSNITTYSDTGLTAGTTYYYRVSAYNIIDSAYSNEANTTILTNWYNANWSYRQKTTIFSYSRTMTTADLPNFPVLIKITDQNNPVFDRAQADGGDILFTNDGVTKLAHEIESYNNSVGSRELIAWVSIPTLSASTDTVIYMYYGNNSASNQQNPLGVWDSDYKAVWHLKEDQASTGTVGLYKDSTSNNNHGNDYVENNSSTGKVGQVNGGQYFDGDNDYIVTTTTQPNQPNQSLASVKEKSTVEAWVNLRNFPTASDDYRLVYEIYQPTAGAQKMLHYILFTYDSTNGVELRASINMAQIFAIPISSLMNVNEWAHIAFTYDKSVLAPENNFKIYINGNSYPSTETRRDQTMDGADFEVAIGRCLVHTSDNGGPFDGYIDELRISDIARSAEWIKASYDNQKDPATYVSFTSEDIAPLANPGGPYTGIEGQAITLNGSLSSDPGGSIALYEWDINNDGTYEYSSSSSTQSHTYTSQGTYTIKLRVTDNGGATAEATTTASISDTSPTADFTANPTSGAAPLTVNFTNTSTGYDQPLTYQWDFDNNGSIDSTLQNPSYAYTNQGTYSVKLTATDSDGSPPNTVTRTNYITVTPSVYTLTISKSGAGSGTVTSSPSGINCGTDCTESYTTGTTVTLTSVPDAGSTFTGWSGDVDCSDGVVTMNANKTCTATFNTSSSLPVKIGNTYYSTLQAAYNAAGNGATIQVQAARFTENLNINRSSITVTIDGGYNDTYTAKTGKTSLKGQMTISNGKVTVKDFILEK